MYLQLRATDLISSSPNGGNSAFLASWFSFCVSTLPYCSNSSFVLGTVVSRLKAGSSVTPKGKISNYNS